MLRSMRLTTVALLVFGLQSVPRAQAEAGASFDTAAARMQQQLEEAVEALAQLREEIAKEKIPLSNQLNELEAELVEIRSEYQQTTRLLDGRTLDLGNLRTEIETRKDEATYLSNLLGEYIRNFESRLHISELQRYEVELEQAKLALENTSLDQEAVYAAQAQLLMMSVDRLHDVLGGTRFAGSAVDSGGLVQNGTFVLVGPSALFQAEDGATVGTAEQRLGSLEPAWIEFANPEDALAAAGVVQSGAGAFPLDPTLGNAHKIAATDETFLEHVQKGGPVMVPIFAMAGIALLITLYKWLTLTLLPKPSRKKIDALLKDLELQDQEAAAAKARAMKGPFGEMLAAGVAHVREPKELIEEVMYETVLKTRLALQRLLPFVAICAAAAPLLGLLGTVTGIIKTFKMITVFGSGDVKSLSGGISEALITTKFGLIVAIPSLLLHAFLSRKAHGVIGRMESTAISFLNQVGRSPFPGTRQPVSLIPSVFPPDGLAPDKDVVRTQVQEVLGEMLTPAAKERPEGKETRAEPAGPL